MKKIIELAEFVCNNAKPITRIALDIDRLEKELIKRKALEQTPITEDWLKEHGWEKPKGALVSWRRKFGKKTAYVGTDLMHFEIVEFMGNYKERLIGLNKHSLADLYDALELCNIQID